MSEIFVITSGNGVAWVDNAYPFDGDSVTLYAQPDLGETLDDVYAYESHGYGVAVGVGQPFIYHDSWGDLTIYVIFSGGSPPVPEPFPAWLLFKISENNRQLK